MTRGWLLVLVLALASPSCKTGSDEEGEPAAVPRRVDDSGRVVLTPAEREALDLQTTAVQRGKLATSVMRFGKVTVRPEEQAIVVAPVTARLAAPPTVMLGSEVKQGTALAAIEPLPDSASRAGLAVQRRELQGQVEGSRARVRALQTELDRLSTLVASQLATEAEKAQAQGELQGERARLASLRLAGGEIASMTGGSLTIRAPAAGLVTTLTSSVGALVQQGEVLARIVRLGPRWIDVGASPDDGVGSAYRVRTTAGWVTGRLLSQGAVVQSDGTRLDRIEVLPPEAARVLPGATVAIDVIHELEGIVIPEKAVVLRGAQSVVFVEVEDGRYVAREVTVGLREGGQVLVSGVEPNERIVSRGGMALLGELGHGSEGRAP